MSCRAKSNVLKNEYYLLRAYEDSGFCFCMAINMPESLGNLVVLSRTMDSASLVMPCEKEYAGIADGLVLAIVDFVEELRDEDCVSGES
ncbi:9464_t:CDS:2 [Funneliformis mosseae]|uniref:9464_t:CDS:1 n=1 Tax=Funneliformis mosseae TaxID=27381 RepID=A0A9N8V736_FUNMO|nr:9464_t:CDS:2 [Funneliformis mosseae]